MAQTAAEMTVEQHQQALARIEEERQNLRILHPFGPAKSALRSAGLPFTPETVELLLEDPGLARALRHEDRLYREGLVHHNAIVAAQNKARNVRAAAKKTAEIREASCKKCFMVHAGDCL